VQVEYLVVCLDQAHRKVRLSLRQADILAALASNDELVKRGGGVADVRTGSPKYVCDFQRDVKRRLGSDS
jgi:glutamate--cysteine ligase catalytic subunit